MVDYRHMILSGILLAGTGVLSLAGAADTEAPDIEADTSPGFMIPELPAPESGGSVESFVYDISLHKVGELQLLLERLEKIAGSPRAAGHRPEITLVLHGPEIRFFTRKDYPKYRGIVDLAARLDAFGVIEVKMCQTRMRSLGVSPDEVPGFIEQVPYGPAEVERLEAEGYRYM